MESSTNRRTARIRVRHLGSGILVCLFAIGLVSTDLHAALSYRKLLTIDNTRVAGTEHHEYFPVLVSLTNDTDLQANVASAQGFDIQFRASDGRRILDHEIESYHAGTGTLVAWVRIPALYYNSDTTIYIYDGDPGVTCSLENPGGVWTNGYEGVWHLKESGTGVAGEYKDSTSNLRHGTRGPVGAGPFPAQAATNILETARILLRPTPTTARISMWGRGPSPAMPSPSKPG